ncbi:MAG: hypothetical protein ACYDHU_05180 [Acidimicrobiales bacterium]
MPNVVDRATEPNPTWRWRDYARYGRQRTGQLLAAGVAGQIAGIAVVGVAWVLAAAHDHTVTSYVGAAVPQVLVPKVEVGSRVIAQVSPTSVRFVEAPANGGARVVLGTFPRGLGYAHLGAAGAIGHNVLHYLLPWAPLVIIVATLAYMAKTIAHHRLLPSPVAYVTTGRRRTTEQLFTRRGAGPRGLGTRRIDEQDAGRTLAAWARRYGYDHGDGHEEIPELVILNHTRRQPSFGSVIDARTRLRPGWTLIVPTRRHVADGRSLSCTHSLAPSAPGNEVVRPSPE